MSSGKPALNRIEKLCLWAALGAVLLVGTTAHLGGPQAEEPGRVICYPGPPCRTKVRAPSAADLWSKDYIHEDEDPDEAAKIEAALVEQGYFRADVPLDYGLQDHLRTACEAYGVPWAVALGLIEAESGFQEDAANPVSGCYGLCQLNPKYFPAGLSGAENIRAGMAYLGEQLERYDGDLPAALTAYNAGYDTGRREYAEKVMQAAERWEEDL